MIDVLNTIHSYARLINIRYTYLLYIIIGENDYKNIIWKTISVKVYHFEYIGLNCIKTFRIYPQKVFPIKFINSSTVK